MVSEATRSTDGRAARVLLIDAEAAARSLVADTLGNRGFIVREAAGARAAERELEEFDPDLVLLEALLPDGSGFALARRLREHRAATPLMFLTARDSTDDKVAGLAVADDYVTKPCSAAELIVRIRAVLRRSSRPSAGVLRFADVELSEEAREAWRAGTRVELTPREFDLLRFFMRHPRRVFAKQEILAYVWDADFQGDANAVETYVSYLRKKLDPLGPPLIRTVRHVGYSFREPHSYVERKEQHR